MDTRFLHDTHITSTLSNCQSGVPHRLHYCVQDDTCYASMQHGPLVYILYTQLLSAPMLYINEPSAFRGSPKYTE